MLQICRIGCENDHSTLKLLGQNCPHCLDAAMAMLPGLMMRDRHSIFTVATTFTVFHVICTCSVGRACTLFYGCLGTLSESKNMTGARQHDNTGTAHELLLTYQYEDTHSETATRSKKKVLLLLLIFYALANPYFRAIETFLKSRAAANFGPVWISLMLSGCPDMASINLRPVT